MDAFVFRSALCCADCIREFKATAVKPSFVDENDESSYDSDDWPKGPYAHGGGEADTPQHCDMCGVFLENPLTPDGEAYVESAYLDHVTAQEVEDSYDEIAQALESRGHPVVAGWVRYYLAWGQ